MGMQIKEILFFRGMLFTNLHDAVNKMKFTYYNEAGLVSLLTFAAQKNKSLWKNLM